ncbi:sugar ABC transporter ATP-binding protein [Conexibacter sp. CPCC 206217]|uniref:sugar ABC transporter ATP-binding protein n=1 Tax=Conexibacter sp. CPCC 206217 TaxID=3064574 RepID=UPI002726FA71|nr:sugar ABC transporter ATP-binding protein [Conexibacter sp. CPCC 206217]MDO8210131.1 sugar ABC transporter ATP-binding protein [Conexibacter sp. CPCC 206217]
MNQRSPQSTTVLEVALVSKAFGGQLALDNVDLALDEGEVHALLGQNGSGKSTLIKVLAGFHKPERGARGAVRGTAFELGDPSAAHQAGLRFIHQDLALIGELSAIDNLALGERYAGGWFISDRRERARVREVFAAYEVDIDPDTPLRELNRAQQTMTAIVRALHHQAASDGILVLDEPTAAFSAHDTELLFRLVRRVAQAGGTVLYVTHRLEEVFAIADRVTVLRDGRKVATRPTAELTHGSLVNLIIDRPLEELELEPTAPTSTVVVEVRGLVGENVASVDLDVHAGEIVGLTGLKGSGADDILHLMFGSRTRDAGEVRVNGKLVGQAPDAAIKAGLALAPADRKELGGILTWTLRENLTLPRLTTDGPVGWLGERSERRDAQQWLDRVGVVPAHPEALYSSLSGGNQQKVVLARWLRCGAAAFLLEEPTGGVDVGARHTIYAALRELAAGGACVLISSSDTEEVCAVCDRVLVVRDGRLVASLEGERRTVDNVLVEMIREESH